MIRILKHKEIDKKWWDKEIRCCSNALIYAKSWYLDAVSPGWGAAIIGNDEAFIPLTHKKYFGLIPVWLQPMFCQQLGVFTKSDIRINTSILKKLSRPYFKTQFHQNAGLPINSSQSKTNYILRLNKTYEELRGAYSKDARKNLRKPIDFEVSTPLFSDQSFQTLLNTYLSQYGKFEKFSTKKTKVLKNLLFAAKSNDALRYIELTNSENQLLFTAALLKDEHRIYYLFASPTDIGRSLNITHYFIDYIIQSYSESNLTLDFEGSMIPSVAQFYKKWGVQTEIYGVFP